MQLSGAQQQELRSAWLHREQQIEQLAALLQQRHAADVLVHGPPCTGKTGVVRAVVAACRPHAYLRCTRSSKLKQILSAVLSQLQAAGSGGAKRKRAQGYTAPGGSEVTLIADLQAVCGARRGACDHEDNHQQQQRQQRDQQPQQQLQLQQPQQRIVVLDDAHHLLMGDDAAARPGDGAPVLRGLLQLREQAALSLSFVIISGANAGVGPLACLGQCCSLQVVAFPQYSQAQLRDLLVASRPEGADAALFGRFLGSLLLASTAKVSLCLPDLRTAAAQLWPDYLRPLGEGGHDLRRQASAAASDADISRLFATAGPRAAALARSFEPALSAVGISAAGGGGGGGGLALEGLGGGGGDLELPLISRFLLVAAYIASRNRPSVDKQLFENSSGARRRGAGGRRRGGQQAQDRQAEAAKAAQLMGPHSFTLQRLLAIYRMLRRADPSCGAAAPAPGVPGGTCAPPGGSSAAAAAAALLWGAAPPRGAATVASAALDCGDDSPSPLDVDGAALLAGVSGLVSRRLLGGGPGGGADALGAPRYTCEVPAGVAEEVALGLRVNLAAYLRYV